MTIGGGIFALPAAVALGLGTAAPLAYLVCVAVMILVVLCFAEAGSRVSMTGGPYAYVEVAFGGHAGFITGVLVWLAGTFALAAVATVFTGSLAVLVPALGGRLREGTLLLVLFALLAAVNVRGVKLAGRLVEVTTAAKLLALVFFIGVGAMAIQGDHLAWPRWPSMGALGATSVTLLFAFAGIESALVPSGEVRDPARTVPRAVLFALAIVTVIYLAIQIVAQGVLGPELASPDNARAPLAAAAQRGIGAVGRTIVLLGAVASTFGYVLGMTLAMPRALYAFAADGIGPRALAAVHPRFSTPHIAIIVQAALAFALAASGTFVRLVNLANISLLLCYLGCALAAWALRRRNIRGEGEPFRIPGGAIVPWLTVVVIAGLLLTVKKEELLAVAIAVAAALVVYVLSRRGRAAVSGQTAA